jgi:hypothetical protein
MNKLSLSLALCAAFSFAVAVATPTPADAQAKKSSKSSKSSKSKPMKVTVQKSGSPVSVISFNNCAAIGAGWGIFAPVAAVTCGAVFAVPVIVESFVWRKA